MDIKKTLLDVVSGAGAAGKSLVEVSGEIVKTGEATVGDLVQAALEVAKETGKDATELVKEVVVGAVNAASSGATAGTSGAADVIKEAEKAANEITEEGGGAVRQGIAQARAIIKDTLK